MLVLKICQVSFGIAAALACLAVLRSIIGHRRTLSFNLTLAGVFALAYFLCTTDPMPQLIMLSVLMIAIGALFMPSENLRSRRELIDDIEIGDSTAARRLRR